MDGAGVDRPAGPGLRHQERRRRGFDGAVQEPPVTEATRVERMHARPLTFHRAFQPGPHRRDHRAVVGLVADCLEHLDHRRRERAPVFVADDELLRQLRGLARGERDMPCRRRRLEVLQRAVEEPVERARALQLLDRGLHSRIGVPGAGRDPLADGHERVASSVSRMTAVEQGDDMRSAGRDLVEQEAQLLVRQRPHELPRVVVPGVEQQQVLELARRVAERELRGRQFLAAVAGVGEQRDVAAPGLGEVRPEAGHHTLPRRLVIDKREDVGRVTEPAAQVLLQMPHVVDATVQWEIHRRAIGIDADEQAEDGAFHGGECRADRDRLRTKGVAARERRLQSAVNGGGGVHQSATVVQTARRS